MTINCLSPIENASWTVPFTVILFPLLAKGFSVTDTVTSPTFNIFTLHRGGTRTLVHLDAYRLENDRQIESLMLEDFLTSPYCLAVEWPEKIASWLPANTLHLTLSILDEHRHHVQLSPFTSSSVN